MRLTNDIRDAIVRAVITNRFLKDVEALRDEWSTLAVMTYDDIYDDKTQRKMKNLPNGWLPETDTITVELGSSHTRLTFDPYMRGFGLVKIDGPSKTTKKRVPSSDNSHRVVKQYEASHPLAKKRDELAGRSTDLKELIDSATTGARQMVHSVSTMKKLLEQWPEVEPFAQPYIDKPSAATLPAVPISSLNAKLGLPV